MGEPNLERLRPSRRRLKRGDVFALKPPGDHFYFGRVVNTDARPLRVVEGGILIYVYRASAKDRTPPPDLSRDELLVPPAMINRLPWSRGYFDIVENRPLGPGDEFERHCFRSGGTKPGSRVRYYDEYGVELPGPIAGVPIGTAGLASYRVIDASVSDALAIPRAPM